jgi:hypothetical protein
MFKKGIVIAAAVVGSLLLAGCASQGSGSACGEPAAVPACAPAPVNTCKNMSSCKHRMKKHHHRHHVKKEVTTVSSTSTPAANTTSSDTTTTTTTAQ